jgi:hypothetical protein
MPYDDDITPHQAMREGFRWAPVIWIGSLVTVLGIVAIILIVQPFAQKIDTSNAKHQVAITNIQASGYQNGYGAQQGLIQAGENAFQNASDAGQGTPQGAADIRTACQDFAKVNDIPAGDKTLVEQNCDGPLISPSSPYYVAP